MLVFHAKQSTSDCIHQDAVNNNKQSLRVGFEKHSKKAIIL